MLMSSQDYRESLRQSRPRVYVDGHAVESVADEPSLAPGVNAIGLSYDYALREQLAPVMRTRAGSHEINRMNAIPSSSQDLLNKLEAVRLLCQETGCAQRYLGGDGLAALRQAAHRIDGDKGTEYSARLDAYVDRVHSEDLSIRLAA